MGKSFIELSRHNQLGNTTYQVNTQTGGFNSACFYFQEHRQTAGKKPMFRII